MTTDTLAITGELLVSLLLGLLIGLQRGWSSRQEEEGSRVAGLRTFGLLGLAGGMAGILAKVAGALPATAMIGGVSAIVAVGYARKMTLHGRVSATSAVTAIVTLGLGFLAVNGLMLIATAVAAFVTLLLSSKRQLHGLVEKLGEADVRATARFVILTAVILPLLPDARFGPFDAWNPREIWLVVVLVTGFSFAGYAANRMFGAQRGILATAAIGGLYSSTAVTASLSARLRAAEAEDRLFAAGIVLASALMFARVLVLVALLATSILLPLSMLLVPALLLSASAAILLVLRLRENAPSGEGLPTSQNPFELLPALGFGLLVALMAVGARWSEVRFGDAGLAVLIALSGSFDVDAAIVTVGALPGGTLDPSLAAVVIAIPVILNTLFKAFVVFTTAGWRKGRTSILMLVVGAVAVAAAWLVQALLWR